jgi:hypothetical protein
VQKWERDRDLLLEEALAFAQSVAAAKSARAETLAWVERPRALEPAQLPKPRDMIFEREEIRQRIADFKVTQRKFQLDREEYFEKTLAKARSNSSRSEA